MVTGVVSTSLMANLAEDKFTRLRGVTPFFNIKFSNIEGFIKKVNINILDIKL